MQLEGQVKMVAPEKERRVIGDRRLIAWTGFGQSFSAPENAIRTVIEIAIFVAMSGIAILVWQLREDSKALQTAIVASNLEVAHGLRFLACVTKLPETQREREYYSGNGICGVVDRK
jgi:hypothetical protein